MDGNDIGRRLTQGFVLNLKKSGFFLNRNSFLCGFGGIISKPLKSGNTIIPQEQFLHIPFRQIKGILKMIGSELTDSIIVKIPLRGVLVIEIVL
jgi:hypothetical protein